jgi:hypothetical protein
LLDGIKPLKRRCEAERSHKKAQEWKEEAVTLLRPSGRSKALKGEAQERWELRDASKGYEVTLYVKRVAKPENVAFGRKGKSYRTLRQLSA